MSHPPLVFDATGKLRHYVVPATGTYIIQASGAQGGAGATEGGKGARLRGTFQLRQGDTLHLVVGVQGAPGATPHQRAGGGGGGTFVWQAPLGAPLPALPLLAAGGGGGGGGQNEGGDSTAIVAYGDTAGRGGSWGQGGATDQNDFHYSGGGGAGWLGPGACGSIPTECGGGEQWEGGLGADYCCNQGGAGGFGGGGGGAFLGNGSGGGGGFDGGNGGTQLGAPGSGGASFNGGTDQCYVPAVQWGDGSVWIAPVPAQPSFQAIDRNPPSSRATADTMPSIFVNPPAQTVRIWHAALGTCFPGHRRSA